MAAQTGNVYVFGTIAYRVEIIRANLGVSTMLSSKKLSLGDCDNGRQPKMATQTFARQYRHF